MRILRSPVREYVHTPFKVAVATGLSNPASCRLSAAQSGLLQQLGLPPDAVVSGNFPFVNIDGEHIDGEHTDGEHTNSQHVREIVVNTGAGRQYGDRCSPHSYPEDSQRTPRLGGDQGSLLLASLANSLQFCRTWTSRYQTLARPHWEALLNSTDQLFLITGSCGLQLVLTSTLLRQRCHQLQVLALGPVSTCRPEFPIRTIQGRRDWLSRACCRTPDILIANLGHMGYWEHPQVREIVVQWLQHRISASSARAAAFQPVR